MENEKDASLKGHFLLAMPGLLDPNFSQTVTCICEHTDQGAVGIVVNRLHEGILAGDIFEELGIECIERAAALPIHYGGPVRMDEIFVLHGPPFDWTGCLVISPRLALSNTIDIIHAIAAGSGPAAFLISIGCAGWGPGQLESELAANTWLTSPISEDVVFEMPLEERWGGALKKMGVDPALLSDAAGHA